MDENYILYEKYIGASDIFINIDPGHSGLVNGEYITAPAKMHKHEWGFYYEGEVNRAIAICLANLCLKFDISHGFSTTSNYDKSLSARAKTVIDNKILYPEKKHCLISLHGNAAGTSKATGIECFSDTNNNGSDKLGLAILAEFKDFNIRNRGEKDKDFTLLYLLGKEMDSILLELGFFTNSNEALRMLTPIFQAQSAERILRGVINNYNTNEYGIYK